MPVSSGKGMGILNWGSIHGEKSWKKMHATQNEILFGLSLASDFQSLYIKAFITW